jgi:hypothetical protein
VQTRLGGQAERAGSAVADEKEAVTASVPSKATEVIVKLRLRGLGFDLNPGRLSSCWQSKNQIYVGLILAQDTTLPTVAVKNQTDQGLKIPPIELPDHAQANFADISGIGPAPNALERC